MTDISKTIEEVEDNLVATITEKRKGSGYRKALATLERIMDNKDDGLAMQAAMAFLSYRGIPLKGAAETVRVVDSVPPYAVVSVDGVDVYTDKEGRKYTREAYAPGNGDGYYLREVDAK